MKKLVVLLVALFAISTVAVADSFVVYNTRAQQNPTDIIDWSQFGAPGTFVNTPSLGFTFNGNPFLAGNLNGGQFITIQQGANWGGNFDYGESGVWTGNANFGVGGGGPFAILFGTPVSSVGFNIQEDLFGPFQATVQIYDSSLNLLATGVWNGISNGNSDGSALFIGFGDLSGVNIGAIIISTNVGDPLWNNDFAINDVSLTDQPIVPEPSTIVMLGTGLLGVAGTLRRKLMA